MPNILELINRTQYPTQEQIMSSPVKHKKEVIETTKTWRKEIWKEKKNGNPREKFEALSTLISRIVNIYDKPVTVIFEPDGIIGCCYHTQTKTIVIDRTLSVISTLHELAHHLFGRSETQACRWSVWLFKKVWPLAFTKLRWEGHLLKRQ